MVGKITLLSVPLSVMPFSSSVADRSVDPIKVPARSNRLFWLDASKAYGMFLVYYGHFAERIADLQGFVVGTAAFSHYKFIYAFHMPLFFILSGFVYKHKNQKFLAFLSHRFLTRILPVIFFNLVAIGLQLLQGIATGNLSFGQYYQDTNIFLDIIAGYPFANFITWFLVCLFTVELLHYLMQPLMSKSLLGRVAIATLTLVIGYYLGLYQGTMVNLPLYGFNTWYFSEALVGFSFYQVGILLKQANFMTWVQRSFCRYVGLGVALTTTVALFDLNQGPFTDDRHLVLMAGGSHGHLLLFCVTAMTGTLLILCLSLCVSNNRLLTFVGQNTLTLLGLNFFFAGFTKAIVGKIGLSVFDAWWAVLFLCTALTLISFAASTPVIWLLQKFLPQLIGKPRANGPLLPPLLPTNAS